VNVTFGTARRDYRRRLVAVPNVTAHHQRPVYQLHIIRSGTVIAFVDARRQLLAWSCYYASIRLTSQSPPHVAVGVNYFSGPRNINVQFHCSDDYVRYSSTWWAIKHAALRQLW